VAHGEIIFHAINHGIPDELIFNKVSACRFNPCDIINAALRFLFTPRQKEMIRATRT
jgi:hypothetical protein